MARLDRISLTAAAKLVADCVYATETRRKVDDKARKTIQYAVEQGKLSRGTRRDFSRDEFLWWAEAKWSSFRDPYQIPPRPAEVSATQLSTAGQDIGMTLAPGDADSLRRLYVAERRRRHECEKKLSITRQELEKLREEAAARQKKKQRISAKLSAAGRKGGRGYAL